MFFTFSRKPSFTRLFSTVSNKIFHQETPHIPIAAGIIMFFTFKHKKQAAVMLPAAKTVSPAAYDPDAGTEGKYSPRCIIAPPSAPVCLVSQHLPLISSYQTASL